MLMALLLGIAFHFLAEEGPCVAGINFTARTVLRMGVALLGARISVELLIGLGVELIGLVILGVVATIAFAWLGANFLRRGWRFALLTGGSIAICGASAAMPIAAVLPKNEHSESNLPFTPALSEARLELTDQGMVRYALKTAYRDGTTGRQSDWAASRLCYLSGAAFRRWTGTRSLYGKAGRH